MSWGYKIAAVYTTFVVLMLVMVFAAVRQDYHLVTKEYYAEELQYGARMEQIRNAQSLAEKVKVRYLSPAQEVELLFPAELASARGQLHFYRPSDAARDERMPLALEDGRQAVSVKQLQRGLWRLQLSWEADGKQYFQEEVLVL
jgi:hypothetical protein